MKSNRMRRLGQIGAAVLVLSIAAALSECSSDDEGAPNDGTCGVYTGPPCRGSTLVPVSGNGCLGAVCSGDASDAICSTTGPVGNMMVACEPSPLPCGWATLTSAASLVYATACNTDSDCPGSASCSEGVCYGTACPAGEACSALASTAVCVKGDSGALDAGALDAGALDAGASEGGATEAGIADGGISDGGASEAATDSPAD